MRGSSLGCFLLVVLVLVLLPLTKTLYEGPDCPKYFDFDVVRLDLPNGYFKCALQLSDGEESMTMVDVEEICLRWSKDARPALPLDDNQIEFFRKVITDDKVLYTGLYLDDARLLRDYNHYLITNATFSIEQDVPGGNLMLFEDSTKFVIYNGEQGFTGVVCEVLGISPPTTTQPPPVTEPTEPPTRPPPPPRPPKPPPTWKQPEEKIVVVLPDDDTEPGTTNDAKIAVLLFATVYFLFV